MLKKKIWANFQRIIELFTLKIVSKLSKIWVWDPGSEIRDPEKTYSGSRGQKGTGFRIRIRNTDFYYISRSAIGYGFNKGRGSGSGLINPNRTSIVTARNVHLSKKAIR
jgi:hypothetical protein